MSGHSKWSTIKRKKGVADSKRGKIFTKIIKEITIAAKAGGGDPDGNPRLRTAIAAAKAENMPKDNIERGIKKGTGELPGVIYEETSYEGYGPGGAAVILDILTDNKNRTVAEIRSIFSKNGGNLGETGCVGWMFSKKGLIVIDNKAINEDELMNIAIDAGAEDFKADSSSFEIITDVENYESVSKAILSKGLKPTLSEISMMPQNTVKLEGKIAEQMLRLMDKLEDNDDVSNLYSNFDIDETELNNIQG